jgi:hypothetical protein
MYEDCCNRNGGFKNGNNICCYYANGINITTNLKTSKSTVAVVPSIKTIISIMCPHKPSIYGDFNKCKVRVG